MRVPFVDLRAQYLMIRDEVHPAVDAVLSETAFIGGRRVTEFEEEFAAWVGVPHCVSVANGTDAIEIALRSLGIGRGDEVIIPANTFIATAEGVTSAGARVVFCDCEPDHYTIDVEDARRKITPRTRAIIVVHLYGHPVDMTPVMTLAMQHGLRVIEDASQAHGARYRGSRIGTFGDAATFSFYPGKNLGAYGDGGAIVCRDERQAQWARAYANHGSLIKYQHIMEGRNSRLDGIQAAVLSVKLRHIDFWNRNRRRIANRYAELLADVEGVEIPRVADWAEPVWHLYVVRVHERERIAQRMADRGVATGIHYPVALPFVDAYRYLNHTAADFPVAAAHMGELLSLPMYPELTDEQIVYTVDALRAAIEETLVVATT